tara:strand:- start:112 stop:762 length:651 start_codon:yes stop_codon:yes gene_type:complete
MDQLFQLNQVSISLEDFLKQISVSLILSIVLAESYRKFSLALSNKIQFSNNLILVCVITTLVISIVKSSLALSLGLVGALSIVRFRTAIKDPEDLSYLFLSIAIGLGTGAGLISITSIAFIFILLTIIITTKYRTKKEANNLYLALSVDAVRDKNLKIVLDQELSNYKIKRIDVKDSDIDYLIEIGSASNEQLDSLKNKLKSANLGINFSIFEDVL